MLAITAAIKKHGTDVMTAAEITGMQMYVIILVAVKSWLKIIADAANVSSQEIITADAKMNEKEIAIETMIATAKNPITSRNIRF